MSIRIHIPNPANAEDNLPRNLLEECINSGIQQSAVKFCLSEGIEDSDFFLLPSVWNYYIDHRNIDKTKEIIELSQKYHKRLIIFSSGDYTANGAFEDCVIIQSSGFKSRNGIHGNDLLAIPTFIDDYLKTYCQGKLITRKFGKKPVIGFCGQSTGSWFDYIRRNSQIYGMNLRYKMGLLKWEPPHIEPTRFRHDILTNISSPGNVQTNFLMRTKYRGGYRPTIKDPFHPTRLEFVNNIINSDYTLCMRGAGNFSVRFYETLALGRIPVFVNTDCILPFDDIVNYKEYMVWVEQDEFPLINQKILEFHNRMDQKKFNDLQEACRKLWETYLTKEVYCENLATHLKSLHNSNPRQ